MFKRIPFLAVGILIMATSSPSYAMGIYGGIYGDSGDSGGGGGGGGCTPVVTGACPASTLAAAKFTCSAGSLDTTSESVMSDGSQATWTCDGTCGGSNSPTCYAYNVQVQGVCNNAVEFACNSGNVVENNPPVSGTPPMAYWTCSGVNGGMPSGQCSALAPVWSSPINGVCGSTSMGAGACASGNPVNISFPTATTETWYCAGISGGTMSSQCGPTTVAQIGQPPYPISSATTTPGFISSQYGSGVAVTAGGTSTPLTIGQGSTLGLTIFPNFDYGSSAPSGGQSMGGQVLFEQPIMLRGVAPAASSCGPTSNVGAIRFNAQSRNFEGCNGVNWVVFNPAGTPTCVDVSTLPGEHGTGTACYVQFGGMIIQWGTQTGFGRSPAYGLYEPFPIPFKTLCTVTGHFDTNAMTFEGKFQSADCTQLSTFALDVQDLDGYSHPEVPVDWFAIGQ
jgi:hypothetical protein